MKVKAKSLLVCGLVGMLVGLAGCGDAALDATAVEPPSSELIQAQPWPEADLLFRTDPKWLGSDDAYSIDLGHGRVLWLFGDSFIALSEKNTRRRSVMIRNSVGIQSGYDPSAASMQFHWRTQADEPRSFFPEDGEIWFWPGHGIAVEGKLFIFLMATRSTSEGIGFEHVGWRAVAIDDPGQPPSEWHLQWLETPQNALGLIVSGSVIQMGDRQLLVSADGSATTPAIGDKVGGLQLIDVRAFAPNGTAIAWSCQARK